MIYMKIKLTLLGIIILVILTGLYLIYEAPHIPEELEREYYNNTTIEAHFGYKQKIYCPECGETKNTTNIGVFTTPHNDRYIKGKRVNIVTIYRCNNCSYEFSVI